MIIYYGTMNNLFCHKPELLSSCLLEKIKVVPEYVKCPALQDFIKNTFVIRSSYDYEFNCNCETTEINSKIYNQEFFDNQIIVRDISKGFLSYKEPEIIFFAEKSLEMEQFSAFFHNTFKHHIVIPGKYNIGKHFRKLECALQLFNSDVITIREKDPLYYVRFFTDEKIIFKKFFLTPKLLLIMRSNLNKKNFTKSKIPLQWYYENNYTKTILNEIKNNLLE